MPLTRAREEPDLEFDPLCLPARPRPLLERSVRWLTLAIAAVNVLVTGSAILMYKKPFDGAPSHAPLVAASAGSSSYSELPSGESTARSRAAATGELRTAAYRPLSDDPPDPLGAYARILAVVLAANLALAYVLSRRLQTSLTPVFDGMSAVTQRSTAQIRVAEASLAALQAEVQRHQEAAALLRDADRRKDEFLAMLAHELRNPLAPIRHAVKLLDARTANAQQQQWGRSVIGRQVQRMALLLDDLLDISRITRGQLNLKIEVVDLQSVVDAALEVARPLLEAKQHRLTVTLPEEHLMLSGDPLRLSQSLSNLLTNAAKYTDEGGNIILSVTLSANELKFTVKDTGIGIDAKAIGGIFDMFSQVHSAVDRAEGGLGIGLALVKGLADLHGGRVEAASAGIGCGSEFSLYLPRSLILMHSDINPPVGENHTTHVPSTCKLLIADDNRDAVDSMAMIMQLVGYEVSVAYTGQEALSKAATDRPDVVLLDIGMPDMTGYDVARAIRDRDSDRDRPIYLIAMTGWGQTEDKKRTLAAGFDQHLTKPVDPDQVDELLREFIAKRDQG